MGLKSNWLIGKLLLRFICTKEVEMNTRAKQLLSEHNKAAREKEKLMEKGIFVSPV